MKRHPELILAESGRNYQIISDLYTNWVKSGEWQYWILKKKGTKYSVLKVIPMHNKESPN